MDSLKLLHRSILALLCLAFVACGEDPAGPQAERIDFEAVAQGRNSRFDDLTETRIRDAETWATVRQSLRPIGTIENVDFSEREVLLVAMPVTTGGYDLEVERVERVNEATRVHYIVHEPGEDCLTAQVLLTPFAAVAVPRSGEELTFHARTLRYSCGVRQN